MQINGYARKIVLICSGLTLAIIVLSVALYSQGPRVRFIQNIDSVSGRTLTAGSSLQIVFDRPIEQRDYDDVINISPDIGFTTKTNTQSITLTLQYNLQSDTDYTVTVAPEVRDKSGKKMKNTYERSFLTTSPRYAYLERNYGFDPNAGLSFGATYADAEDHIMLGTLGSEPEVIFSHPQIRLFAANDTHAVVAVKEEEQDALYTINLTTKEVRNEQLWSGKIINNLTLAPRSKTALFTTQPDFSSVSAEFFEEFAYRIESLNLDDGTSFNLTDLDGDPLKAYSIDTDTDGQIALMQDLGQAFYAVSPFNDFEPVLLGTYPKTLGFSSNGREIIFREGEELIRYDIASADIIPIDLDGSGYVVDIEFQGDAITYRSETYSPASSYGQIERIGEWSGSPVTLWRSEAADSTTNLRAFSPSYDNTRLALHLNPKTCQYDDIGIGSECRDAFLRIIDPETQRVLKEFRGSSIVWLP